MDAAGALEYWVRSGIFSTSGVADEVKTVLFLYVPDTAGLALQVIGAALTSADNTPVEKNVIAQLARVDDISGGSAGTGTATTPVPYKSRQRASSMSAKHSCSAEPSTYGTEIPWGWHAKNGLIVPDAMDGPICEQDQGIGLLAGCRDATALDVVAWLRFREIG